MEKNFFDKKHRPRLSVNLSNVIEKEKTKKIFETAFKNLLSCPLHSIFFFFFWILFCYIFRKTFKWKYNCLKHTIFSFKHKNYLLQVLINKSFPLETVNSKIWDKLLWNSNSISTIFVICTLKCVQNRCW